VEVPALIIGGWFDLFLQGTLDSFMGMRHSAGLARQSHLLVGPWSHQNYGSVDTANGDIDFGVASGSNQIDMWEDLTSLHLRWFDHWLKGIDNGIDREPPVQVFLTGEKRWLRLPDWPPPLAGEQDWYLGAGGELSQTAPVEESSESRYTYDPKNPVPTIGGNTLLPGVFPPGVRDQRPLSQRPDVLTFTGVPLDQPLTVIGRVTANLRVSSSAPDTDFVVRLIDQHPDGYMENVCDGIKRCRYRHSLTEPEWLEPGKVYELPVDLWSTAHTFLAGHRVAVQVSSSSFPRWDRNWNTKEDPGAATQGQPATQTIWHSRAHPSHVVLPV
jgi:putative CocE/NonD family hydrolase